MSATVATPVDLVESVAHLRLPRQADRWLQELMNANTIGSLTAAGREQLTSLVDWSVSLSRARAWRLLGERPVRVGR